MALVPVFKPHTIESLQAQFQLQFDSQECVSIELPFRLAKRLDPNMTENVASEFDITDVVEYECNRYDAKYTDPENGHTLSVYIYMNEGCNQITAIDDIVENPMFPLRIEAIHDTSLHTLFKELTTYK